MEKYLASSDPAADGKEWFHHRRADHILRRGADGHVRKEAAESVRFRNWYDFPEYRGITLSDPEIGAQICESVRAHEKRCGFITPISGGMSGRKSRREIKDMTLQRFADMGLSDGETIWNSYPSSLSGGMNQRVGIALAMLLHPSLLLADEPTSALDVVSQAQVLRELQALQQKEQTGMVLVTHNLAVLEQMADRVAVLKDGNIVEQGETRTVFDHPKDEYTKNLLAAVPGRGKNDA